MNAPIILFVYNRPIHTERTIEALKKNDLASDSLLYIFSDGPKNDASEEQINNIQAVREIIHSINGFKKVVITERKKNYGLDVSIRTGVSEIIKEHHKCIVLEDDIITHTFFLRYINEALDKYANAEHIHMIGGYNNRMRLPIWYRKDVLLAPRCCAWGWGTWEENWERIDWTMSGVNDLLSNQIKIKKFCLGGNDKLSILKSQINRDIPAWDTTFDYSLFINNGYVLFPKQTLTVNIGCDGTGNHVVVDDLSTRIKPYPQKKKYDIKLPKTINPNRTVIKRFKLSSDQDSMYIDKIIWSINKRLKYLKRYIHTK